MSLVTLFEDSNYQGKTASINSLGNYKNLRGIGFPDNALSSLKIGPGIIVELYDRENYQGSVRRYCGPVDIPNLGDFSKRTSSIRVLKVNSSPGRVVNPEALTPRPSGDIPTPNFDVSPKLFPNIQVPLQTSIGPTGPTGPTGPQMGPIAILYTSPNYRGISVPITNIRDVGNLCELGFPLNELTSIKISTGYSVTLFDGENFTGASKRIDGPTQISDLGTFARKAKSIRINHNNTGTTGPINYQATTDNNWIWWIIIILIIILILWLLLRNR